uniref:EGF-like domain-containing protein n=2 Tax=Magallana gigas TaxID=29159 RepID=A0A8W8ILH8_MAGGI
MLRHWYHSVLQSRIVRSKPVAMHSLQVLLCVFCVAVGFQAAQAALGGGACTIPAVGAGPGASTVCTAAANGFCLIDHLTVTGAVTGVTYDSVCVCYTGYSGPQCATATPTTTTTTTTSNNNAITALVLGGLGAYLLSQSGQGGYGAETGAQAAQEALYLQQAGFGVGK